MRVLFFCLAVVMSLAAVGIARALPEFATVAELNNHIERTWGQKSERAALYRLALDGVRRWPENAEILGRAAYLESMLGIGDHGLARVWQAWQREPRHWAIPVWTFGILTEEAHRAKTHAESVPLFLKAIRVRPEWAGEGYYFAGLHCWYKKPEDVPQAVEWFRKSVAAGYREVDAYRKLGEALHWLKRLPEADEAFRQTLALWPRDAGTLFCAARLARDRSDTERWRRQYEEALVAGDAGFRKNFETQIRDWLAQEYAGRFGQMEKAREHLRALLAGYPGDANADKWKERLFWLEKRPVTVRFRYAWPAEKSEAELILPVANAFQRHLGHRIVPEPDRVTIRQRFGNMYALVGYRTAPVEVTVETLLEVRPQGYGDGDFSEPAGDDAVARYLARDVDSRVVLDPADPALARLAAAIVGNERETVARARLIQEWIERNIRYKVVYPLSIAEYLKGGEAECGGHALVFVALCRAAGIPARRVFAPLCEVPQPVYLGSHMVSEFYAAGKGWIPVDNSGHVFGRVTASVFFWRVGRQEDPDTALYPEKTDQFVTYTGWDGRPRELRRD